MNNEFWDFFSCTGNIEAYLAYKKTNFAYESNENKNVEINQEGNFTNFK